MIRVLLSVICLIISPMLLAQEHLAVEIRVTEPYLQLHTGPASEYRIEHILLTGEKIQLVKQHADWFYFRKNEKVYGWAQLKQLLDNRVDRFGMSFDEFLINYEGELEFDLMFKSGFMQGDFLLGFELGHALSEDSRIALSVRQVPGKISETRITTVDYEYFFNRRWKLRPFVSIGYGELSNTPSAQVVAGSKMSSAVSKLGVGTYFAESKRVKFLAALTVYSADSAEFTNKLQELSIGLKYEF
ncbi:MAG: hypothetical protein OEY29_09925 [Gammaproteobacteria bacterium]|nr:hypothetical protein [Gammaproteobacteria bacterium]